MSEGAPIIRRATCPECKGTGLVQVSSIVDQLDHPAPTPAPGPEKGNLARLEARTAARRAGVVRQLPLFEDD